jgi:hypothetical protein
MKKLINRPEHVVVQALTSLRDAPVNTPGLRWGA